MAHEPQMVTNAWRFHEQPRLAIGAGVMGMVANTMLRNSNLERW